MKEYVSDKLTPSDHRILIESSVAYVCSYPMWRYRYLVSDHKHMCYIGFPKGLSSTPDLVGGNLEMVTDELMLTRC